MSIRAYIQKSWGPDHRLVIIQDGRDFGKPGKVRVATELVWREEEEGMMFDPMDGIGHADELVQSIVDRAWEAGFRPRGYSDVKNETAAIRDHLSDMKAIAFHKLGIKA